jgi:hypothetical protein
VALDDFVAELAERDAGRELWPPPHAEAGAPSA